MPRPMPILVLAAALGVPPALALDDTSSGRAGVPDLGQLDVGGKISLSTVGSVDLAFAGTHNPTAIKMAPGNRVSFCPALSCIRGPADGSVVPSFFDHQRASLLVSARTQLDGAAEEQTLAVTTTIGTGYARPYAASTAYAAGDNVNVGNATYRAVQGGTTGANSAPPGTRPPRVPFVARDGSVRWEWINDAAINSKVGAYFETEVVDGAGAAWGAAFNYHIKTKPRTGQFFPGVEFDYANDSGTDCALGVTDCTAIRVGLGGSAQVTHGLQITGDGSATTGYSAVWALRINGEKVAQQASIEVDSMSAVGLGFGVSGIGTSAHSEAAIRDVSTSPRSIQVSGTKSVATIEDTATTPTFASIGGTKSLAGLREASTTPTGILLQGRYATAQISGAGWSVNPAGILTAARLNSPLATPASSRAPCQTGDWAHDTDFVYTCVAANTWKRAALSSW